MLVVKTFSLRSMTQILPYLVGILFLGVIVISSPAKADFSYELSYNSGYIGNLFLDSLNIKDGYSTTSVAARYYPISQVEVELTGSYTYYSNILDLSNFLYSGKLTFIPTANTSPFQVYLSGSYDRVIYRESRNSIDNNNTRLVASLGYSVTSALYLRAGTKITESRYPNFLAVDANHEKYEFFGGVNITLPGKNSLDFEVGTGRLNFVCFDSSVQAIPPFGSPADSMSEGELRSYYISPRFSRPLGAKTGLSITYTYRHFKNPEEVIIFGFSTEYLSPWAVIFEGPSIMVNVKTYVIPHMVISTGFGYWEKTYMKSLYRHPLFGYGLPKDAERRHDYFSRVFFSVKRPILVGGKHVLEPTVSIDYSKNNSTLERDRQFDYSNTTVSVSLVFRK